MTTDPIDPVCGSGLYFTPAKLLAGEALVGALAQYEVMRGLPPGWVELPPIDPMAADAEQDNEALEWSVMEASK